MQFCGSGCAISRRRSRAVSAAPRPAPRRGPTGESREVLWGGGLGRAAPAAAEARGHRPGAAAKTVASQRAVEHGCRERPPGRRPSAPPLHARGRLHPEVPSDRGGAVAASVAGGARSRADRERGLPASIVCDNGPEFAGKVLDGWGHDRGVVLQFIRRGKPVENAYIKSFIGKFREECRNAQRLSRSPTPSGPLSSGGSSATRCGPTRIWAVEPQRSLREPCWNKPHHPIESPPDSPRLEADVMLAPYTDALCGHAATCRTRCAPAGARPVFASVCRATCYSAV